MPRESLGPGLAYLKIGTPDFGQMIQRILRMKGTIPDLTDPRYNLGVTVEDATRPEFWWTRRGQPGAVGGFQAAVAAQQSLLVLSVNQRKLVIIEQLRIFSLSAVAMQFGFGAVAGGGTGQPINSWDDRAISAPGFLSTALTATIGTSAAPVLPAASQFGAVTANGVYDIPTPIIITGLSNYNIILSTINVSLGFACRWRERELYPEEF